MLDTASSTDRLSACRVDGAGAGHVSSRGEPGLAESECPAWGRSAVLRGRKRHGL